MDLSRDLSHAAAAAAAAAAMSAAVTDGRQFGPCVDLYGRAMVAAGNNFMASAAATSPAGYGCYFRRAPVVAATADSYDRKSPSASFSSEDESCGSGNSGGGGYNETGRRRRTNIDLQSQSQLADHLAVRGGSARQELVGLHSLQQNQQLDIGIGSDVGLDYEDDNDRDRSGSSTGGPKKHKAQKQVYLICNLVRVTPYSTQRWG